MFALRCLVVVFLYNLFLISSLTSYNCTPYNPPESCETTHGENRNKFEVRFYENSKSKTPHALAVVGCIHRLPGRYKIEQVEFFTEHRTEFMDELEIPLSHVGVCKVQ